MSIKFFKPDKKKIFIAIVLILIIGIISSSSFCRVYQNPYSKNLPNGLVPIGGLFPYKLNPICYLPAPLFTSHHDYIWYFPVDNIYNITYIYWILISYLLACTITYFTSRSINTRKVKKDPFTPNTNKIIFSLLVFIFSFIIGYMTQIKTEITSIEKNQIIYYSIFLAFILSLVYYILHSILWIYFKNS